MHILVQTLSSSIICLPSHPLAQAPWSLATVHTLFPVLPGLFTALSIRLHSLRILEAHNTLHLTNCHSSSLKPTTTPPRNVTSSVKLPKLPWTLLSHLTLLEHWILNQVIYIYLFLTKGFPDNSVGKESTCNADSISIPVSGRPAGEGIGYPVQYSWAFLVAQLVKNLPAIRETWVRSLGWADPPEKGKATQASILAWRIPWTV